MPLDSEQRGAGRLRTLLLQVKEQIQQVAKTTFYKHWKAVE